MKIHVSDIKTVGNRVFVEGIRNVNIGGKWVKTAFTTVFDAKYFSEHVHNLKFPIVFDIKLVKGVGALFNE